MRWTEGPRHGPAHRAHRVPGRVPEAGARPHRADRRPARAPRRAELGLPPAQGRHRTDRVAVVTTSGRDEGRAMSPLLAQRRAGDPHRHAARSSGRR